MPLALLFTAIVLAGLPVAAEIDPHSSAVHDGAVKECPITEPGLPLVPPAPYPIEAPYGTFWHGTSAFWTMLTPDGRWAFQRSESTSITQKVFWWRPGFNGVRENYPDLSVTLRRLDASTPPVTITERATNAYHEAFGGWTMLTGVKIPTPGCWEITGRHRGSEVSFVVHVADH